MKLNSLFFSLLVSLSSSIEAQDATIPVLDVHHYEIWAEIVPEESFLKGRASVRCTVLEDTVSLPFELNRNLSLLSLRDENNVQYSSVFENLDSSQFLVRGPKAFSKGTEKTLTFEFEGILETQQYAFLDVPEKKRAYVHRDGALLLSEGKWFPSHRLPVDDATFVIRMTVPLGFTAVGPGVLGLIRTLGVNEVFTWRSVSSITRVPVVISRFFRQRYDELPVPLIFYVTEEFEGDLTFFAEEVTKIINFFEEEYGSYGKTELNLVQVGNVELPSTSSSQIILLDSKILDASSLRIMTLAQRVANQWWGHTVRFKNESDSWLADGFSTYAALRYLQENHPDQFSVQLARQAVETLKYESRAPISRGLQLNSGSSEYESIVSAKGAWVLYMLSQLVGPKELSAILNDWYHQKIGRAVSTSEWVNFVQQRTGENYSWFFSQWVHQVGVPEFSVDYTIYKLSEGDFKIQGQLKQDLELFRMPLDLLIRTKGQNEEKRLTIIGKNTAFTFKTDTLPLRIEFDPHGKVLSHSPRMRVLVHIALGKEYQEAGDFLSAIREYEKSIKLDPRSSLAHFRLGRVFFEQQNLSSAANSFRDSLNGDLALEWVETWTHIFLGKVYDIMGQRQRARAEYQKAINTGNNYNGAKAEAEKYFGKPYTKPSSLID